MRHEPFNPHEHLLLGAELSAMRNRISNLGFVVQDAYGKAAARSFFKVADQISRLKSGFEDRLCREIPRAVQDIENVPVTKVYYGWVAGPEPRTSDPMWHEERAAFRVRAVNVFDEFGNPWKEK